MMTKEQKHSFLMTSVGLALVNARSSRKLEDRLNYLQLAEDLILKAKKLTER
jgi:hypothetical protein